MKTVLLLLTLTYFALSDTTCSTEKLEFESSDGILKVNGKQFNLKGLSWFGYETSNNVFHGLWAVDYKFLLDFISSHDFNAIRVPFYLELVLKDAVPGSINYFCSNNPKCNADLLNLTSLQILDKIVDAAAARGLTIMFDLHSFLPGTFMQDGKWYDASHPEEVVISGWETLVKRYSDKWNVIAIDVKNEPHDSTWGTGNVSSDFNLAVERIGNAVLSVSDVLIFAEGVCYSPACETDPYGPNPTGNACFWGEDLKGVAKNPIKLSKPNKLVYSPHVYGPDVAYQKYFEDPNFPKNMPAIWEDHWSYVRKNNKEAVVVGEWGGSTSGKNGQWMTAFTEYLTQIGAADNFFWCLNPDSGDTGGLLENDWITPVTSKLDVLAKLQPNPTKFTQSNGKVCVHNK